MPPAPLNQGLCMTFMFHILPGRYEITPSNKDPIFRQRILFGGAGHQESESCFETPIWSTIE